METHISVMRDEIISLFLENLGILREPFFIADATLGAGGHTEALLETFPACRVIGFDQDGTAEVMARERLARFGDRLIIRRENFSGLSKLAMDSSLSPVMGVLFDLGVSNMQLTSPERGFSFGADGPLDMRMNTDSGGITAGELLQGCDVRELTRIFREYGEERNAFQLAKGIVRARERGMMPRTTGELTALIRDILPAPVQRKMGTHPARRVFQALRIAVNDELAALSLGLGGAMAVTSTGGVIAVLSYHSLEDRIVKRAFRACAAEGRGELITRKPMLPSDEEAERNRSARSAKLRALAVL